MLHNHGLAAVLCLVLAVCLLFAFHGAGPPEEEIETVQAVLEYSGPEPYRIFVPKSQTGTLRVVEDVVPRAELFDKWRESAGLPTTVTLLGERWESEHIVHQLDGSAFVSPGPLRYLQYDLSGAMLPCLKAQSDAGALLLYSLLCTMTQGTSVMDREPIKLWVTVEGQALPDARFDRPLTMDEWALFSLPR